MVPQDLDGDDGEEEEEEEEQRTLAVQPWHRIPSGPDPPSPSLSHRLTLVTESDHHLALHSLWPNP